MKYLILNNLKLLFGLLSIAIILHLFQAFEWIHIPHDALFLLRWSTVLLMCTYALFRKQLTTWIFVSMILGICIGYDFPLLGKELNILSKIFIKMIKTIIAPLLFGTLVVGIAGHSNLKQVGRLGWKSLVYFEIVTTIALIIGLVAINYSKAGIGIPSFHSDEKLPEVAKAMGWKDIVLHTFPENFIKSISEGQILQIVVFCILFAVSLLLIKGPKRKPILDFADSLSHTMFSFTNLVMYFSPFAVGGALAYTVSNMGLGVLSNLLQLLGTLYVGLLVLVFGVFLPLAWFSGVRIRRFLRYVSEPLSIAFGTASSEAALPIAMENMEKYGVSREVVSFVLPTGLSFNLDGTTLYLSMASIFVAQAAGIQLSIGQQITMMLTLMLTSKGVAGVARASLVILAGMASSFGLPDWPIAAILGIDALMDMARTAVNTLGNCLATVIVGKWENEVDEMRED